MDEVESMTKIVDPTKTIKTPEASEVWRETLIKKWQLKKTYTDIEPLIVEVITKNCRGNPYLCLDYFKSMLHGGFINLTDSGMLEAND